MNIMDVKTIFTIDEKIKLLPIMSTTLIAKRKIFYWRLWCAKKNINDLENVFHKLN